MDKQASSTYTTTVLVACVAVLVVTSMGVGVVTARDELDVTLDLPEDVTAGEETTLSGSVSIPDLLRDYERDLTVTFSVDGEQIGSKTLTVTDGSTTQFDLAHTFESSGTKEVTVTAETNLGGRDFSGSASGTIDVAEPPISIDGDLSTTLSVSDRPTAGEETTITVENRIPALTGTRDGELTLRLLVDEDEVASKSISVQEGDMEETNFTHVFETSGKTTVTVEATLTAGDQSVSKDASTTVDVGEAPPDITTHEGVAFAVPESLEDEVNAYREGSSRDLNASTFVLATQTELYIVFTDGEPTKGRATVEGLRLDRNVSGENLTYGAIAATSTSFETTGTETTVEEVATDSERYRLDLVRITAHYRRISTLTDPDSGSNFTLSTTSGVLLENPRTATSLFQNLSGKARGLSRNTSSKQIDTTLDDPRRTHLHTFSFETKFWTDAEATVDAIVLDPNGAAQQFIDEYDQPGLAHADDGEPTLYVVEENFQSRNMDSVTSIKSQADSLDGEVVETTVRLYQERVSVQETLEHTSGCGEDRFNIPGTSSCVNIVQDTLLHGGVAWNSIPQSRADTLLVLGVSSRHQDTPAKFRPGRYRIAGEVVSTSRLNESLPDGSVVVIYELDRQGNIEYESVAGEARALIEARTEQLRTRLREKLSDRAGKEETSLRVTPASQTIAPGESTTYEIVLDHVNGTVSAYDIDVSVGDTGTATITDATNEIGGVSRDDIAADNSSVEITASGGEARDSNVVIATVTVTGEGAGNATLSVTPEFIVDGERGVEYSTTTIHDAAVTTVTVGTPPTVPDVTGDGAPATDPDDDGHYEDVDGDGDVDGDDVRALFKHRRGPAVRDNVDIFDFNDNDRFDFDDIVSLSDEAE